MSQPFLTMKLPLWASVFIDERHSFCELSGREEVQRGLYRRKIVAKPTYYLRLACAWWHCNHYFRGYLFLFGNVCVTLTKKWNNWLVLGYWLLKKNYNEFTYHNTPRDNNNKKTVVVITLIILRAVTSMDVTSSCLTLFSQRKHLHTSLEIFAIWL